MIKTYTFKIRRPEKHSQWIESTLGATRFVYNLSKETREEAYKKGVKLSAFEGKMDINERDTGKNSLNLGLDLEYNYKNKFSVYASYNTGVLSDKDSAFTAGFKYQF